MKKYEIISRNVVQDNPDSPFNYFGWPTIARLGNGDLAVVSSGYRTGHVCPFGKAVISFSRDEGKTWTLPTPVIDTWLDDRDSGICTYGNNVIVTSFNNTIKFQRVWAGWRQNNTEKMTGFAKDHEAAGVALVRAYLDYAEVTNTQDKYLGSTYRISRDNGVTWGEIYKSPVTCPHGPIVCNDGTILYIGRTFSDMVTPAEVEAIECWAMDGEGHMEYRGTVPPFDDGKNDESNKILNCEPHAICLANGKIIVHVRVQRNGAHPLFAVAQSVSTDGGRTFSNPVLINGEEAGSPAHLVQLKDGTLLSSVARRKAPFGVRILISRDEGESWEETILTDDAPNDDLGYPATVELSDGTLYTVWYQHDGTDTPWNEDEPRDTPSRIYGAHWKL